MKTIKLINFQGINCYYNSIATLVYDLGLDYKLLFGDLWSECDLFFDEKSGLYSSKRLIANLAACGAKILPLWEKDTQRALNHLKAGESAVVCFDAFNVFWNSTYRLRHGTHYFIVRKSLTGEFVIFDPTLNKTDIKISTNELAGLCIDIFAVKKRRPDQALKEELLCVKKEAVRAEKSVSTLKVKLVEGVASLQGGEACIKFAKYCDALTNNRFMFRHFVFDLLHPDPKIFMPDSYLLSFVAVKNGLFKLSLTQDVRTKKQIAHLLSVLLENELKYAAFLQKL